MRIFSMLLKRARALLRGAAVDRELADEMAEHLRQLADEHIARGMTPDAARAAARREFGSTALLMEESREARGIAWIAQLADDMRYGVRLMRRNPGFAAAAALTVALGIGATTAMFSIVYGVLLQPLPYRNPDRLVNLWSSTPSRGLVRAYVAMANVGDWKQRNHVFEDIAAVRAVANFNLIGQNAEPERLFGSRVSANLLSVLGVSPIHGRGFTADEERIGFERVAILSCGLWKRRFAADPSIVGRTIDLSGVPHVVVGVMGPDFAYPSREYQIWTPLTFNPDELVTRSNYSYLAVARLKPGVSIAQARAEMDVISAQLAKEFPQNRGIGTLVAPMASDDVAAVRTPLYVLLAAVVAMLLIGCANLANLLLARALARGRELAVRVALGAGRSRLVRQSIAEILPLLGVGGALGVVGAGWTIRAIVPMLPADLPRAERIALDVPALAFAAALVLAIAVAVGAWPALEALRGATTVAAGASRGTTADGRRTRMRDALVVGQIAATLWLAVAALLLTRSFAALRDVHPGFNPRGVYGVQLAIPRTKYRDDRAVADFCARVVERARAIPGVVAAAMVNRLPLTGSAQTSVTEFEGLERASSQAPIELQADMRPITPDYFRVMQIPLIAGRGFTEADDDQAAPVAIVDERIAKTVYKDVDPIGRRVRPPVAGQPWRTIIGVVGHIRNDRLEEDGRPQLYWSYRQNSQDREALVVRAEGDPAALAPSIAAAIRSVDPDQPIYDAGTLEEVVDKSMGQRRMQTTLLGGFAAMALLLASVGVYGVVAYGVGQRRREFGIRLALGSTRAEIVGLVLSRGAALFACGAGIGLLAAAATARVLGTLLFHVSGFDPFSFVAATAILFAVALIACGLPARRAASVDASVALRTE